MEVLLILFIIIIVYLLLHLKLFVSPDYSSYFINNGKLYYHCHHSLGLSSNPLCSDPRREYPIIFLEEGNISLEVFSREFQTNLGMKELPTNWARSDNFIYFEGKKMTDIDRVSFSLGESNYVYDNKSVWWDDAYLSKLDPATLKVKGEYAWDSDTIYFKKYELPHIDISSFEVLEGVYARDKFRGYEHGKTIENSDGLTFQSRGYPWSQDKQHLYYYQGICSDVDLQSVQLVNLLDSGDYLIKEGDATYWGKCKYQTF